MNVRQNSTAQGNEFQMDDNSQYGVTGADAVIVG
jgi:hypothetical protein